MKYAIFIDIDGTLTDDKNEVSNRCKNIIRNIVSIGHYVILCTARYRQYAVDLSKQIGASNYVLTSNGAELYDYKNDKVLYSNDISSDTVINVLNKIVANNLKATLAIDDGEYIIGKKYGALQYELPSKYEDFIKNKKIKQFMVVDNNKNCVDDFRKYVLEFNDIDITNKNTIKEAQGNWFSFVASNTSKGYGVSKFCEIFNVTRENTISIGNDYNDISMFKISGISVAVNNALPDILEIVDEITDSNNKNGVAKILEKFYLSIL